VHGLTLTKYADWTPAEFKALLGKKSRDEIAKKGLPHKEVHDIADEGLALLASKKTQRASCTKNWASITSIRNQGTCGSCWAFSTATTLRAAYINQNGIDPGKLSTQFLVDCMIQHKDCGDGVNGCCGGDAGAAMEWIAQQGGIPTQADYGDVFAAPASLLQESANKSRLRAGPVSHTGRGITYSGNNPTTVFPCKTGIKKTVTMTKPPQALKSESAMESHICNNGPVAVAVDANSFQTYKSGVFQSWSCGTSLDHAVTLIGVDADKNAWIIQNSWGQDWGVGIDGGVPPKDKYNNCADLVNQYGCTETGGDGVPFSETCLLSCSDNADDPVVGGYMFMAYGTNTCGIAGEAVAATSTVTAGSADAQESSAAQAGESQGPSGGICVTGSGTGGCLMTSACTGGDAVKFTFSCDGNTVYTMSMSAAMSYDFSGDCWECGNIDVKSIV